MNTRQRTPRHTSVALLLFLGLIALSAGCADRTPAPDPAAVAVAVDDSPQRGGTAVLGSISDVDSWNEYTSQQSFASNVLRRIYLRRSSSKSRPPCCA